MLVQLIACKTISIRFHLFSGYFLAPFTIGIIIIPPVSFRISVWQSKLGSGSFDLIHYHFPCLDLFVLGSENLRCFHSASDCISSSLVHAHFPIKPDMLLNQ